MEKKKYAVIRPFVRRGHQHFVIEARNRKEAIEIAMRPSTMPFYESTKSFKPKKYRVVYRITKGVPK